MAHVRAADSCGSSSSSRAESTFAKSVLFPAQRIKTPAIVARLDGLLSILPDAGATLATAAIRNRLSK
ncbi:hypothetical protein PPGU19_025900 [Paraburkholderia sp. PGU19]|nr:hypothetical protein PPGU19_025900 [Paraburkholderia sp. PGU19]